MYDAVIEEIDGRRIRVGDHWLADFASCNYLGFDLEPEIMDAIEPEIRCALGHPPELVAAARQPRAVPADRGAADRAARRAGHAGAADDHAHPHVGDPDPGRQGTIFLDSQAHKTIYDGCMYARGLGATVQRFRANDLEHLAELLRAAPAGVPGWSAWTASTA
jgi:8-amino-7-oxononanoate synthase